jgi:hypothetical protein
MASPMSYSPYAPPRYENQAPYGGGFIPAVYKPLGWMTTASIVGLIGTVVFSFIQTGASIAFGEVLKHPARENLGLILGLGVLGLAVSAVSIFTWVIFLVWTHRAASNVRAFGQQGLEYTPGWCVGWWFIPIASLWKPFDALREIFKASDPDTVGPGASKPWQASSVPAAFKLWWVIYILNGFLALAIALGNLDLSGKRAVATVSPANFVTHAILGVAGAFLIILMRELARRQEASWQRLSSAQANPPGPGAYGPPAGYGAGPYGAPPAGSNPYV